MAVVPILCVVAMTESLTRQISIMLFFLAEDEHQIPVEGHPDATNNYLSVQNCLENFINPGRERPHYPPVFTLREEWKKVDYTLSFIKNYSRMGPRAATIKVHIAYIKTKLLGLE